MIYLDTSALVKLVVEEAETAALRKWLAARAIQPRVTSTVSRVELVRAVAHHGSEYRDRARELLTHRLDLLYMDDQTLDRAADLPPAVLRSLDAIHLATGLGLGDALSAFVAYDKRLSQAVTEVGLQAVRPT